MRTPRHFRSLLLGCLLTVGPIGIGFAQTTLFEEELVSREVTVFVESGAPDVCVVSREYSLLIHNGPIVETQILDSREVSLVVTTLAVPDLVTQLTVDVTPTGEDVSLDWNEYDELAQDDLSEYWIYVSTTPFTNVSSMTPHAIVSAGNDSINISGLPAWIDHYFAVVAVDDLGGFNSTVEYSAAYVLSPEIISREMTIHIGSAKTDPRRRTVSREVSLIIQTPEPPAAIADFTVDVSPTGDSALLDWSSYDELLENDIVRYDIYYSTSPFTNVTAMTPYTSVNAKTQSLLLVELLPWTDHYFAIVPVDAVGGFIPTVSYGAAYVLSPEVFSREVTFSIGGAPRTERRVCSREVTLMIADDTVPVPVTGPGSGFAVEQSVSDYQALDLDWSHYDELAQVDIVRYRIYVAGSFFDDVTGMEPFTFVPAGIQRWTLSGLTGFGVYHIAVVAEDTLGNMDPSVQSESGQASTVGVGEVENLQVVCGETNLTFSWNPPLDSVGFLDAYNLYFGGATEPISLNLSSTTWVATNLFKAHGYPFRITTTDIFDTETGGLSLLAATLMDNPTNVFALGLDQQVQVTWNSSEPESILDYYAVYQSDAVISNISGMTPLNTTTDSAMLIGGLVNYSNYYFAVAAVNVAGGFKTNVQSVSAIPEPDLVGAHIIGFSPDEPFRVDDSNVEQLFSGFTLTFSEPIADASLSIADIVVSNIAGAVVIESITPLSLAEYHIRLHEAYQAGSNTVLIGTNILDTANNPMTEPFETVVMLTNPALVPGSGDGLLGTYYNGSAFAGTSYPRIDETVNFDWHANAPISEIGTDYCSIRWTGQIEPRYDGDYLFTLVADDGVRLWIDGALIIDEWRNGSGEQVSTHISLTNDQRVDVQIDYFESTGDADIQLQWQFATLPKQVVPQCQLYSGLVSSEFVVTPVMTPPAGIYYGITDVSLSSATTNAQIYYTQGDTDPYGDWMLYDGAAIRLISNAVIRAIAVKDGLNDSGVRVANYDVSLVPVPDYDWWKTVNFLGITNESVIGRTADPDLDGIPNSVEYAYCLDPNSDADAREPLLESGVILDRWMVYFEMPANQLIGSFCWSSNLLDWIDVVIEKTNNVWFARNNHCDVVGQNILANEPDQLLTDSLLLGDNPLFFRFDRAVEPLAVTGQQDMIVYPEDRVQVWYLDLYLRAEDLVIEQTIEIAEDQEPIAWQIPATFTYSNNVWSVDNSDWVIISQSEELYTEWVLRVKLPVWPVGSPVSFRYSVRDISE